MEKDKKEATNGVGSEHHGKTLHFDEIRAIVQILEPRQWFTRFQEGMTI